MQSSQTPRATDRFQVRRVTPADPKLTLALRTRTAAIHPTADTLRIVAFCPETAPVRRILSHIGEPAERPRMAPARGPPAWDDPPVEAVPDWDALAQPSPEYVFDQEAQW